MKLFVAATLAFSVHAQVDPFILCSGNDAIELSQPGDFLSFDKSQVECMSRGGDLTTITSADEHAAIIAFLQSHSAVSGSKLRNYPWVGINGTSVRGPFDFVFTDGTTDGSEYFKNAPANVFPWRAASPVELLTRPQCVMLYPANLFLFTTSLLNCDSTASRLCRFRNSALCDASAAPTDAPSMSPIQSPNSSPVPSTTRLPTTFPTFHPTKFPIASATDSPTIEEPGGGDIAPTSAPSESPTQSPNSSPVPSTTRFPTTFPIASATHSPTIEELGGGDIAPTGAPSRSLTQSPNSSPVPTSTKVPTKFPTFNPTKFPMGSASFSPTEVIPTSSPTGELGGANGGDEEYDLALILALVLLILVTLCCIIFMNKYCNSKETTRDDESKEKKDVLAGEIL